MVNINFTVNILSHCEMQILVYLGWFCLWKTSSIMQQNIHVHRYIMKLNWVTKYKKRYRLEIHIIKLSLINFAHTAQCESKINSGDGSGSLPSGSRQCHIEFTRAQFSHHTFPRQAVKQFTSTSCLHFRKELQVTSVHAKAVV